MFENGAPPSGYGTYGATSGNIEDGPVPLGYSSASLKFSDIPLERKQPFIRGARRRLNFQGIFISLFAPWITFIVTFYVLSSPFHYKEQGLSYFIVAFIVVGILLQGRFAINARMQNGLSNAEREPSWMVFLFFSLILAFMLAVVFGTVSYANNTYPYYQVTSLNDYHGIDPSRMRGQQLLDAGSVSFTAESWLDTSKSMGFRNLDTYCVAPITVPGTGQQKTYDFWAVGTNCCSGTRPDFHCPNFRNPRAHGGLRLMQASDRQFYRLAVQQAEAAHGIKAAHPLFFHWVEDPFEMLDRMKVGNLQNFVFAICGHLTFQTFVVVAATVAFSKITG
mmetsp:Transcript_31507/g.71586  ORF Transcript_31507/g.71586 Transcript_31507/m.71586 type:complete len:335 (-) Transcript_31507:11-1015(-)